MLLSPRPAGPHMADSLLPAAMLALLKSPTKGVPLCTLRRSIDAYFSTKAPIPTESLTGSAKLFADAENEPDVDDTPGVTDRTARLHSLESRQQNWTGDEPMEHAVLRMLVDKYKPLRTGTIQSAEERLKKAPPSVSGEDIGKRLAQAIEASGEATSITSSSTARLFPKSGSWATEPLLPSIEGHRPWHTTFKAPSHVTPSIKLASLPPPSPIRSSRTFSNDEQSKQTERQQKKRVEQAGRLVSARESTIDYRLGIKERKSSHLQTTSRPNPVSVKGWASLVEERIEKAKISGVFNNVKGRGQPIVRKSEEYNPFIAREEYIMNRIVQRNGAAPPWVEIQQEMEAEIRSFRAVLRQAWTRYALRSLTVEFHSYRGAHRPTFADVSALRDNSWEQREASYHDAALLEINSLVRKYNTVAPYAVRRPLYMRTQELEKMYKDSVEDIMKGLDERLSSSASGKFREAPAAFGEDGDGKLGAGSSSQGEDVDFLGIRDMIRQLVRRVIVLARWK
ncbi:hypothetical protein ONZ45_g10437 [Pleurotus djamor]|nr:hypothetical protein ONZ45_g10437 [Pleurotus djamor]